MRIFIILLSTALSFPASALARVAARTASTNLGATVLSAPVVFGRSSLVAAGSLTGPSLSGTLPILSASIHPTLPVTPVVRKAASAVHAVPAPAKRPAAITVLRESAQKTEKKKKSKKKSSALTQLFDGGSRAGGGAVSALGSFGPSVSGLGIPVSINAADSASGTPSPVLQPVAGSIFSRVRRPWLGPLKAMAFRAWSEFQRIRRGKPRLAIGEVRENELERLVEITDYSRLGNHKEDSAKDLSESGFLAWTYSVKFFKKYIDHPDARILVARDKQGIVQGFVLLYGKGVIVPGRQSQEFNLLARRAVEKAYGPDAEFLLAKLMASDPSAPRGTGRQISNYIIAEMLENGIDLIATTLVNDEPLRGTRFDIPESKLLHNAASGNLAKKVHGKRVATGFMYGHTKEKFNRDISELQSGIHAFDMFALGLRKNRPFPAVEIPSANLPD